MQFKRLFVSLLVVILILSAAAFTASANTEETFVFAADYTSAASTGAEPVVGVGDTVEVSIKIEQNPGASYLEVVLSYDATVLTPVVENGENKYELNNSLNYKHGDSLLDRAPVSFGNGKIKYLSDTRESAVYTDTGVLATFYFTVKEGACADSAITVVGTANVKVDGSDSETETYSVANGNLEFKRSTCQVHAHGVALTKTEILPTCTTAGYYEVNCASCGYTGTVSSGKNPAHSFAEVGQTDPTCTEDGHKAGQKCTACGLLVAEAIPATGHQAEVIPAVEPTYSSVGYEEGSKCAKCGVILHEPKEIPAKSLTWLWITLIVVVVVAVVGGLIAYFLVAKKKKKNNQ